MTNAVALPEVSLVDRWREDFPILRQEVRGHALAYLDNAATTQKPAAVIEATTRFYERDNANVHRAVHALSARATASFEAARRAVQGHIGAGSEREIVFTRGATEAINLVAQTFGRARVHEGDEILVSGMEHHSNIVPWQMLCEERGAKLRVLPITDDGELALDELPALLNSRTRLFAVTHVSNALGTINPIADLVRLAHERGVPVLVDGAQAVAHLGLDMRELDADFYVFSGHKVYGPTGIGVLYGKLEHLEAMPPWQGGGDMISSVSFARTTYAEVPHKFEAGTPNIAGVIGLAVALDYVAALGVEDIARHERELLEHATSSLRALEGVRLIGTASHKSAVVSFVIDGIHPHDVATIVDHEGIAIRSGHHCAQPVMERFGLPATVRASFGLYNTHEEIDRLVAAIGRVRKVFG